MNAFREAINAIKDAEREYVEQGADEAQANVPQNECPSPDYWAVRILNPPPPGSVEWKRDRIPLRDANGVIRAYVIQTKRRRCHDLQLATDICNCLWQRPIT